MHKPPYTSKPAGIRPGNPILQPVLFFCLCVGAYFGGEAFAHTSEQVFVLLLPTRLYTLSGVAAVALTVVVMGLLPAQSILSGFRSVGLPGFKSRSLPTITSLLSLLLLGFVVFVGLYGPRDPFSNSLTLTIWTLWWIGFLTIQALFGDLWRLINPWTGLYRLLIGQQHRNGLFSLPQILGLWPGIVAFCLFAAFMLADIAPDDPARLARLTMAYWVYTFVGMILFGGKTWLARGECFTILLRYFSMVSAFKKTGKSVRAGMPGWQLVHPSKHTVTGGIFVLIILAVGSFDGLNETFWWLAHLGINPLEFPGRSAVVFPTIVGLIGAIIIVTALFATTIALGNSFAGNRVSLGEAFGRFSLSVLPITVGYHIAHYLTTILVNWQYALAAATDPWATGADHLGLDTFYVTTGFFSNYDTVRIIWLIQAGAVVAGHILAICVSHAIAIDLYKDTRKAAFSQIPPALFMVAYTLFGLWLLAAPRGA